MLETDCRAGACRLIVIIHDRDAMPVHLTGHPSLIPPDFVVERTWDLACPARSPESRPHLTRRTPPPGIA